MAKTGIKITTVDTVLGAPIDVNKTSVLIFFLDAEAAAAIKGSSEALSEFGGLNKPTKVTSYAAFTSKFPKTSAIFKFFDRAVADFFHPYGFQGSVNNSGNTLWIARADYSTSGDDAIPTILRATVAESFDNRPRQIGVISCLKPYNLATDRTRDHWQRIVQKGLNEAADDSIRCVAVTGVPFIISASVPTVEDYPAFTGAPFVANSIASSIPFDDYIEEQEAYGDYAINDFLVGRVLGLLSATSVGTSIGDGGLSPMNGDAFIYQLNYADYVFSSGSAINARSLSSELCEILGEKQCVFPRTRPPRNGLWFNDGATCNDADNALSTLEAARTICSMADDLQSFFVPYINSRVPVTSTGDIQPAYKQVVLDNARAAVVQKYIDNGDISDARINLVAKDNDMIGTRTWEVTLSILPAPTLRWIDSYVFYVKSL